MAACGAGAATQRDAADQRAHDLAADDPESLARIGAFLQGLQELGWTDGRNVRLDYRWARGRSRALSQLRSRVGRGRAGRNPGSAVRPWCALQQANRDGADRVRGDQRSGRRRFRREPGTAGRQHHRLCLFRIWHRAPKSLELLKQIAPAVTRAAVLRDPSLATGIGQLAPSRPWRLRSGSS